MPIFKKTIGYFGLWFLGKPYAISPSWWVEYKSWNLVHGQIFLPTLYIHRRWRATFHARNLPERCAWFVTPLRRKLSRVVNPVKFRDDARELPLAFAVNVAFICFGRKWTLDAVIFRSGHFFWEVSTFLADLWIYQSVANKKIYQAIYI